MVKKTTSMLDRRSYSEGNSVLVHKFRIWKITKTHRSDHDPFLLIHVRLIYAAKRGLQEIMKLGQKDEAKWIVRSFFAYIVKEQ